MDPKAEFRRTIGYGEIAIGQLKRNEVPAYPRHYELWYTYAAGYHHELNRAIQAILERGGRVDADATTQLYNEFISPSRLGDEIEALGSDLSREIDAVASRVGQSLGRSGAYREVLEASSGELRKAGSARALGAVIEYLVKATADMAAVNGALEEQLGTSQRQIERLRDKLEAIRFESLSDELTKLGNRKLFNQSIERAIETARAHDEPLSLLITDVDNFKRFNDSYGHQTGDQVLRLVAMTVKANVKGQDVPCRYGGEEFAIILPQTPLKKAVIVAEIIRKAVMARELVKRSTGEALGRVTISIGVASLRAEDTSQSLIERADRSLYAAKRAGRNQVRHENEAGAERRVA